MFVLTVLISAQVNTIYIDVRIFTALQRSVPPIFNVDVGFLIQFTNGSWRHLAAPQGFGDILHSAHGNSSEVHLNECFFYTALAAAVTLNSGCFKGNALEARNVECDGSGDGEAPVIVAAVEALTGLVTFVASRFSFSASASNSSLSVSSAFHVPIS